MGIAGIGVGLADIVLHCFIHTSFPEVILVTAMKNQDPFLALLFRKGQIKSLEIISKESLRIKKKECKSSNNSNKI